jgi:hypothetical protein
MEIRETRIRARSLHVPAGLTSTLLAPVISTEHAGAKATECEWRDPEDASFPMPIRGVLAKPPCAMAGPCGELRTGNGVSGRVLPPQHAKAVLGAPAG